MANINKTYVSDPPLDYVKTVLTRRTAEETPADGQTPATYKTEFFGLVPVRFNGNQAVSKEVRFFELNNGDGDGLGTTVTISGVDIVVTLDTVKAVAKALHKLALAKVTSEDF